MNPIQLQFTLNVDSASLAVFSEVIRLGVENGNKSLIDSFVDSIERLARQRIESGEPATDAQVTPPGSQSPHPRPDDGPQLIEVTELAKMLGISPRTIWRLKDAGKVPKPISIGSRVRWRKDEITEWIKAGCPPTVRWKWKSI